MMSDISNTKTGGGSVKNINTMATVALLVDTLRCHGRVAATLAQLPRREREIGSSPSSY